MSNNEPASAAESLGDFLKRSRNAVGLTLRAVESKSSVTNGYLSQIEGNAIRRPSANVLVELAQVYGLDHADLLQRAGHRIPTSDQGARASLSGVPLSALADLNDAEQAQLMDYLAYLKSKRGN